MNAETLARRLGLWGGLLSAGTTVLGARGTPMSFPFSLWSAAPWAALYFAGALLRRNGAVLGAALTGLTAELAVRCVAFVWPSGSTSGLVMLFSPAYILIIVMPAGALLGWLAEGLWVQAGRGLRAGLAAACALALLFEFLAIAKPQWLPMNLARTSAMLKDVGEPRVVTPGAFHSRVLAGESAWFSVDDLDGLPGDELVVVDRKGALILDPATGGKKDEAPFSDPDGRLWNWYSRLVALEDGYAVVQTGGGFQKTELRTLSGQLLWNYKPDANLEPSALRPADLDGDGSVEFYAASARKVCRLDHSMKEVWCVPAQGAALPVLARAEGKTPGWLVVLEYRRMLRVLDPKGGELGSFVPSKDLFPLCTLDLKEGRLLFSGGAQPRLLRADGTTFGLDARPPQGWSVVSAASFRPKKGEEPLLALLYGGKGIPRFLLRVLSRDGQTRYEEVFDAPVGLLPARLKDGSQSLLLASSKGLRALSL